MNNTIKQENYQGLYGTGRTALYLIAAREGITISRDEKRILNVAGLRDLIARARQNRAN